MKLRVVPGALSLIFSDTASGYSHAVMWSKGTITGLGTLGSTQSAAYAINDNGQIVAADGGLALLLTPN